MLGGILMMLFGLKILAFLLPLIWALDGILIIYSISNTRIAWTVNVFMGIVFLLISAFLAYRAKVFLASFVQCQCKAIARLKKRLLVMELFSNMILLLLGLLFLSGINFRIFSQGYAIFG